MTIKNYSLSPLLFSMLFFASIQQINAQTKTASSQLKTPPSQLKTKSGLAYKIIPGKGGAKPKAGEFIKFNLKYTIGTKDSLMQSTYGKIPAYTSVDTSKKTRFSFMEIVPKMSVGDSAVINISIDSLVKKKMIGGYNAMFKKGEAIKCNIRLLELFKSDSAVQKDYTGETEIEKNREVKDVENYMAQNNLTGIKTNGGAYVVIENAGDTTLKAEPGKLVSIMYKGYLLNGTVFDTNMDSSKGHTDPIDVTVGQHRVITGWEEALPYFGKGGKGKILIPAMLGYGAQQQGADIPAYANLIFDVEILDVKTAQNN